jgi:hypothetical protein
MRQERTKLADEAALGWYRATLDEDLEPDGDPVTATLSVRNAADDEWIPVPGRKFHGLRTLFPTDTTLLEGDAVVVSEYFGKWYIVLAQC